MGRQVTEWVLGSAPGSLPSLDAWTRIDAYLVWDEITLHARHHADPPAVWPGSRHLPVLMELPADPSNGQPAARAFDRFVMKWVRAGISDSESATLRDGLKVSLQHAERSMIHTTFVRPAMVACLHEAVAQGLLLRFTLGAPCELDMANLRSGRLPFGEPRKNVHTLGIIDDGCCFAHESFRLGDPESGDGALTRSRMLALWDQDTGPAEAGSPESRRYLHAGSAKPYAYGSEWTQKHLEAALRAHPRLGERHERQVYAAIGRPRWGAPQHTHGARVMHLLAGPDRTRTTVADAGRLPVVFVQLPRRTVSDTSGDSLGVHVVDGARYIVARTRDLANSPSAVWSTSINISLGSIAGPHDGTSMAEMALTDLVRQGEGKVDVVVAAGNTADRRNVHGQRRVKAGVDGRFLVRVPPTCERDSFVEFWLPTSDGPNAASARGTDAGNGTANRALPANHFTFTVSSPNGKVSGPVGVGGLACLHDGDGQVIASMIFARRVAQGLHGTMALLAIGPTAAKRGGSRPRAPAGIWAVHVSSTASEGVDAHAWIERDDIIVGDRRPQQTRFEHDPRDRPGSSYITESHTLASLSNAADVHVVGGCVESTAEMARYSGTGPRRGESLVKSPDWFAPSDRSPTLRGVVVPGFFSGSRATIGGTSAAAPRITRLLAERRLLAAHGPGSRSSANITRRDVRASERIRPARGDSRGLPYSARIEPWLDDRLQRRRSRRKG